MSGCGCCACLAGAGEHPPVYNRPGLGALRYRIGTHRTFFDAMLRRLTVPVLDDGEPYSLHRLSTRESDDPSIALLDAWATVGDVLTFYQERIANEGFLATATERRSILELGRLVGYTLKPGVAASVYLAYTLDDGAKTIIPAGTKAQSVPGADEKPQTFETSADTEARAAWNALRPRMRRPQNITLENVLAIDSVWIAGTQTRLDRREPLFFVFETDMKRFDKSEPPKTKPGTTEVHAMRRVREVIVDDAHDRTRIVLEPLRPYYTALYDAVLPVWRGMTHPPVAEDPCRREKPPEPPPVGDEPMVVEAPRKRRKKKAAGDEPLMLEAQALVLDVDRLLRDLLLGVQRMTLQSLHGHRTGPDPLPELILAADADPLVVQGTGGPSSIEEFLTPLKAARGNAPASQWAMGRSLQRSVGAESDFVPRLLGAFFPRVDAALYTALSNLATGDVPYDELRSVHVMRRQARVFGYNAPPALFEDRPTPEDPKFPKPGFVVEEDTVMHLSAAEELAVPGGYAVIVNHEGAKARKILEAQTKPRGGYAVSGDSTRLAFNAYWWCPNLTDSIANMTDNLGTIRSTNVFVASERVTLAQQAVDRPVGRAAADDDDAESKTRIELDGVVEGLTAGRYVIVTGVRADTHGTGGVVSAEVAMVANVELRGDAGPGGTPYSILDLAPDGLAYEYVRTTVKILGNVVKATHGETRHQILGAGDASKPLQTFGLQQSPLTFVSAPTVDGVASTLVVRVNDVRWHETDSFAGASPNERVFVTDISDEGKVAVTFGTGREGARLPTGTDNVRATYRSGIGRAGNVRAGQISNAISRPLGVRDVINPIEASGGADPESRDDARRTIPVSLQALGRVVSVRDYADFARTFAGISKASAAALSDGRGRTVVLTIGGADDIEIPEESDLYRNLDESLRKFGDPYQPFVIRLREKIVLAGAARVRVDPDYLWSDVAPNIRAALLDTFSFDRRDYGQPVYPAEVIAAIQRVPGVASVDLDVLGGIRSTNLVNFDIHTKTPHLPQLASAHTILPRRERFEGKTLHGAEIAYLPPQLADLFILTEIQA